MIAKSVSNELQLKQAGAIPHLETQMNNVIAFPARPAQALAAEQQEPHVKPVSVTVAQQVVAALKFYASQGFDGGEKARRALTGMFTVVDSRS